MAKTKFNFGQLALMNWLLGDEKALRFLTQFNGGLSNHQLHFHDIVERDGDGKYINNDITTTPGFGDEKVRAAHHEKYIEFVRLMGGSLKISTTELIQAKFLNHYNGFTNSPAAFQAKFVHLPLTNNSLFRPTTLGLEWYKAEGKQLYEAELAKREARRKSQGRMVVLQAEFSMTARLSDELKAKVPEGLVLPFLKRRIMRPIGTAVVTKQTEKRLQIENVETYEKWNSWTSDKNFSIVRWPVQGREPNLYIEPWGVMVDHADHVVSTKLRDIDVDDIESFDRAAEHYMTILLPTLIEMNLRLKQNGVAREEMMQDAIDRFQNNDERKPR
jgi:hypothetical protein